MKIKCLVLDAMGVVFQAGDDIAELLIPFLAEKDGSRDTSLINKIYIDASSGKMSSEEFWNAVGVDSSLEDNYLDRHELKPGILGLLKSCEKHGIPVWCLSNDLTQWSEKLRSKFDLTTYFQGAVISEEAHCRKPDSKIYEILIRRSGFKANELLFVDDRKKNVDAAKQLGIDTILFSENSDFSEIAEALGIIDY